MTRSVKRVPRVNSSVLSSFYARPAFLLRRANQIAFSLASKEGSTIGLTPPQYAFLIVVDKCPGLDQRGLGKALGFDRVTAGQVLRNLEGLGLIERVTSERDSRRKVVLLTARGRKLVAASHRISLRVTQKILSSLAPSEQKVFVRLLRKIVGNLNAQSPTPVVTPEDQAQS